MKEEHITEKPTAPSGGRAPETGDAPGDDPLSALLLRLGLKQHQLPNVRRWLTLGIVALLALLVIDVVEGLAGAAGSPGNRAVPVASEAAGGPLPLLPATGGGFSDGAAGYDIAAWEERLNRELSGLLADIKGAGTVAVFVRLEASPSQTVAESVRSQTRTTVDEDGRVRRETQETDETAQPVMSSGGGGPIVLSVTSPAVASVLVLADGADDAAVRWRLQQAVQGALGLAAHRIQIVPREVR